MTPEAADSPSKEAYLQLIRLASPGRSIRGSADCPRYAEQALAIDPGKEETLADIGSYRRSKEPASIT